MIHFLEKIKNSFLGLLILIGILIFIILIFSGGAWISEKIFPWLTTLNNISLVVIFIILLPLSIFKKTRSFSCQGMVWASYIITLMVYVWSFLITYTTWGVLGAIIGILFMGIGVIPIAIFALILNEAWGALGYLIFIIVVSFAARGFGFYLLAKEEDNKITSQETKNI